MSAGISTADPRIAKTVRELSDAAARYVSERALGAVAFYLPNMPGTFVADTVAIWHYPDYYGRSGQRLSDAPGFVQRAALKDAAYIPQALEQAQHDNLRHALEQGEAATARLTHLVRAHAVDASRRST